MSTPDQGTLVRCGRCGVEKGADDFYPSALEDRGRWGRGGIGAWCRECQREKQRGWRAANKEKVREAGRRYRAAHREEVLSRKRERQRSIAAQPRGERWYVEVLRTDPCSYCGGTGGHIDHVLAVTLGGESHTDNLAGACRACNSAKGARSLLHFLLGIA